MEYPLEGEFDFPAALRSKTTSWQDSESCFACCETIFALPSPPPNPP